MTPGILTEVVAHATGLPERSVAMYARELREGGLLTTGARGVNAPDMTPLDAARLLIALLVTEKPSKAAQAVVDFGGLKCRPVNQRRKQAAFAAARRLPGSHRFEAGFAALIEFFAMEGDAPDFVDAARRTVAALAFSVRVETSHVRGMIFSFGSTQSYEDRSRVAKIALRTVDDPRLRRLASAYDSRRERYVAPIEVEKTLTAKALATLADAFASDPITVRLPRCAPYAALLPKSDYTSEN